MIELKTYTTPDDYESVILINLNLELKGSSDHPEKDAQAILFRVERNIISYLTANYNFNESMIEKNEKTLYNFKLATIYQTEYFLKNGIESPTAIDEYAGQKRIFLCDTAIQLLRAVGMMNLRSY